MAVRILIVDAGPVQRRLIENVVVRFGYEPVVAEGGRAAVRRLLAGDGPRVDCAILGLVMPDLDGLGVLAHTARQGPAFRSSSRPLTGGIDNVVAQGGSISWSSRASAERVPVSLCNALATALSSASSSRSNAAAPVRWALATVDAIRFAISHYRGQISEVARKLRIGRSTLYRRLETLGLTDADANSDQNSVASR